MRGEEIAEVVERGRLYVEWHDCPHCSYETPPPFDEDDVRVLLSSLDAQQARMQGSGWVYHNPDAGWEYAPNHPIESGEVPDATDVRRSTEMEDHLHAEYQRSEKHRNDLYDKVQEQLTTIGALQAKVSSLTQLLDGQLGTPCAQIAWGHERQELMEALEPFASFGHREVDAEGWKHPPMRERIVDWFGPSDFRRASALIEGA